MTASQINNPLHGITLEKMLRELVKAIGWEEMGRDIPIRCFTHQPSISSSLKFLRRTPWARARVETLYLHQNGLAAGRPRKRNGPGHDVLGPSVQRGEEEKL
jgi:uncharacterized protein (DUF2132 family)